MPDKTVIRLRSAPTSCMLHNVCGARRPSFACALHRNRIKFAARSRENLHDFERRSRAISMPNEPMIWLRAAPTSCVLRNARRPSFCVEVGRVLHARCTKINKICSAFARFLPKICTISNAAVVQSRCKTNQLFSGDLRRRRACCTTFAAHAGRVLHLRRTEIEQNLQRIRAFSRENLALLCTISNAAVVH